MNPNHYRWVDTVLYTQFIIGDIETEDHLRCVIFQLT